MAAELTVLSGCVDPSVIILTVCPSRCVKPDSDIAACVTTEPDVLARADVPCAPRVAPVNVFVLLPV